LNNCAGSADLFMDATVDSKRGNFKKGFLVGFFINDDNLLFEYYESTNSLKQAENNYSVVSSNNF
jgi:hypothetical protein